MKQPSKDLTQGSLWKNIFVFSIPLMLSNVLQVLFKMCIRDSRWNVPSAGIKWSFWNFILTISVFPSKNYMRDLCPDLAESVLLHNFLCFYGIIPS